MIKFLAMPLKAKRKSNCYESRLNLMQDNCFFFSAVILQKHYRMVINRCFVEDHTDRGMYSLMVESKTEAQTVYTAVQLPFVIRYAYLWRKNAKATGERTTRGM